MGIENGKTFTIDDEARIAEMAELAKKGIEVVWVIEATKQKVLACPEAPKIGIYELGSTGEIIEELSLPGSELVENNPVQTQPTSPRPKIQEQNPLLNDPVKVKEFAERTGIARGIYK